MFKAVTRLNPESESITVLTGHAIQSGARVSQGRTIYCDISDRGMALEMPLGDMVPWRTFIFMRPHYLAQLRIPLIVLLLIHARDAEGKSMRIVKTSKC